MFREENHSFVKFVPGIYLVYLSVPKVASSSISHAMLSTCPTAPEHIEEHSATGKALTHWRPAYAPRPDLPVFTYVRHPIDKFTSYYRDKFLGARESGFELAHLRRLGFDPHMSIDEVVEHMLTIPVGRMEHHAQPQHRIIAPGGALLSSFTGSVEDIERTWPYVRSVSLFDFELTASRNTTTGADANATDMSEESLSALVSYYDVDFEVFGYERPVPGRPGRQRAFDRSQRLDRRTAVDLRSAVERANEQFVTLADRLDDSEFRREYLEKARDAFNEFLIFSNHRTTRRSVRTLLGL